MTCWSGRWAVCRKVKQLSRSEAANRQQCSHTFRSCLPRVAIKFPNPAIFSPSAGAAERRHGAWPARAARAPLWLPGADLEPRSELGTSHGAHPAFQWLQAVDCQSKQTQSTVAVDWEATEVIFFPVETRMASKLLIIITTMSVSSASSLNKSSGE